MTLLRRFVYTDVDATLKIPLRTTAKENVERLLRFVEYSVQEVKGGVSYEATPNRLVHMLSMLDRSQQAFFQRRSTLFEAAKLNTMTRS